MKPHERYKLLDHAKKDYSKIFKRDYQFKKLSKRALYKLLDDNKHSVMCEWWYCCYGLYDNCWQELIEEGCCHATQKKVDNAIKQAINSTTKICRRDSRILYCEDKDEIRIIIIARDVFKCDYLIYFTNQKE